MDIGSRRISGPVHQPLEEEKKNDNEEEKESQHQQSQHHPDELVDFAAALRVTLQYDRSSEVVTCTRCHRQIVGGLLEDHETICPEWPITCPLGCGLQMKRGELFPTHLSIGHCPRYVVYCSSFACERQTPDLDDSDIHPPKMVHHFSTRAYLNYLCVSGCDVIGGPNRHQREDRAHYDRAREFVELERFFVDDQMMTVNESKEDYESSSSSASSCSSIGRHRFTQEQLGFVRLSSCPFCLQIICLALRDDEPVLVASTSPPQPIPLNAYSYFSYRYDYGDEMGATHISQSSSYVWPIESAVVWTQAQLDQHLQVCQQRQQERQASSFDPTIYDARDCGIYKYLPRAPGLSLTSIASAADCTKDESVSGDLVPSPSESSFAPTAAAAISDASTSTSSSTPSNDASNATAAALVTISFDPPISLSYTFHQLLLQTFLFQLGQKLMGHRANDYWTINPTRPVHELHECGHQLFLSGASISDLLVMYESRPMSSDSKFHRLRAGVSPLYGQQPREFDILALVDALAPLQRPLVAPLLDPFLIPDLAHMVLDYF